MTISKSPKKKSKSLKAASKTDFTREHTKQAVKQRGEVFTPEFLVEEMMGKLPQEFFTSAEKTMIDNSCGNGNFLVKILEWRMKNGISHLDAIKTIYGVELDPENTKECRQRLSLGSNSKKIWDVLNRNIICANALDPKHEGWKDVGYMWDGPSVSNQFFDFS